MVRGKWPAIVSTFTCVHYFPLFSTILHYFPLFSTVLHCFALFSSIFHHCPLFSTIFHYVPLFSTIFLYFPCCPGDSLTCLHSVLYISPQVHKLFTQYYTLAHKYTSVTACVPLWTSSVLRTHQFTSAQVGVFRNLSQNIESWHHFVTTHPFWELWKCECKSAKEKSWK